MQTDINSTEFIDAMTELQFYAEESRKYQKENDQNHKEETKRSRTSQFDAKDPIPRAETVKEEKSAEEHHEENKAPEDEPSTQDETVKDAETKEEEKPAEDTSKTDPRSFLPSLTHFQKGTIGKHTGMARYKEYDPAAPAASVEAVETALLAMKELQMLKRNHYPYLLVCIKDDGSRTQTKFRTLEEAQERMESEMEMYIDQIEPIDINKVAYVDDGCGAHDFEPTPPNELNPDGTFKHPSEIDGTMHQLKEETKGIVYFETQNATARWDILNLDTAEIGDRPEDPEFEAFIAEAIQKSKEKEEGQEDQKEEKKGKQEKKEKR